MRLSAFFAILLMFEREADNIPFRSDYLRLPQRSPGGRAISEPGKGVNTVTKADLIDQVAAKSGLTKKDAGQAVDALFEAVTEALSDGERVQIVGFGTFEVRERAARRGRNPQTGARNRDLGPQSSRVQGGEGARRRGRSVGPHSFLAVSLAGIGGAYGLGVRTAVSFSRLLQRAIILKCIFALPFRFPACGGSES